MPITGFFFSTTCFSRVSRIPDALSVFMHESNAPTPGSR
jgi:hypothetical protein